MKIFNYILIVILSLASLFVALIPSFRIIIGENPGDESDFFLLSLTWTLFPVAVLLSLGAYRLFSNLFELPRAHTILIIIISLIINSFAITWLPIQRYIQKVIVKKETQQFTQEVEMISGELLHEKIIEIKGANRDLLPSAYPTKYEYNFSINLTNVPKELNKATIGIRLIDGSIINDSGYVVYGTPRRSYNLKTGQNTLSGQLPIGFSDSNPKPENVQLMVIVYKEKLVQQTIYIPSGIKNWSEIYENTIELK